MAAHISAALAQLALLGLVSLLNAHIKSIMIPTKGMAAI